MSMIELDEYECGNLKWLLDVASRLGLNTGDWLHQIRGKLFNCPACEPNLTPSETNLLIRRYDLTVTERQTLITLIRTLRFESPEEYADDIKVLDKILRTT